MELKSQREKQYDMFTLREGKDQKGTCKWI